MAWKVVQQALLPERGYMGKLEQILAERPNFHRSETEIDRSFHPSESLLPQHAAAQLASTELTCYGIEQEVLSFIADNVHANSRTLETGAGCSTLVFAIRGCEHIAVTPSASEIALITGYAQQQEIPLDRVQFIQESSEHFLPRCAAKDFDLILLDGKHAFPWPIVDWFFTADRLRQDGVMLIDDVHLRPVTILAEFMKIDPAWQLIRDFSGKTLAFKKIRTGIRDVAWHMQPYTVASDAGNNGRLSLFRRVASRLRRIANL